MVEHQSESTNHHSWMGTTLANLGNMFTWEHMVDFKLSSGKVWVKFENRMGK